MAVGVAKGVELLHITQLHGGLPSHPGTKRPLQGSIDGGVQMPVRQSVPNRLAAMRPWHREDSGRLPGDGHDDRIEHHVDALGCPIQPLHPISLIAVTSRRP